MLTVTNNGSAPARVGNIVLNLQRASGTGANKTNVNWVTVSSDVLNAAHTATANICSGASSEGKSSFTEGAGNTLVFTDGNNSVFSLDASQQIINPGVTVTLNYEAKFDSANMGGSAPKEGESVRLEAIVSFANAGARGGSGAVCQNVDVDGNGSVTTNVAYADGGPTYADEAYVRSVPCRTTLIVLPLSHDNAEVKLEDRDQLTSPPGTGDGFTLYDLSDLSWDSYTTDICDATTSTCAGTEVLSDAADRWVDLAGITGIEGKKNGVVWDTAHLTPETAPSSCNPPVDLEAADYVTFTYAPIENCKTEGNCPPATTAACTYTQGGWGAKPEGGNPGQLLTDNFVSVYPVRIDYANGGVSIGSAPTALYHALWDAARYITGYSYPVSYNGTTCKNKKGCTVTVDGYLPAGGTAGVLTANQLNSTAIPAAGVLGGQILALQLNVDFGDSGLLTYDGIGDLVLHDTGTSLDGKTVREILAIANLVVGGGDISILANGYTVASLNGLITNLNESFDNCKDTIEGNGVSGPTQWALDHLVPKDTSTLSGG